MIKRIVMQVRYQVELLPSPQLQRHAQVKQTVSNIISREALRNMIDFFFFFYCMKVLIELYVHNFLRKDCPKRKNCNINCSSKSISKTECKWSKKYFDNGISNVSILYC